VEPRKTSTGLQRNVAAAVAYAVFWITGIIMFILEEDPSVRFHAMQSIVVFGFAALIAFIFSAFVPLIGNYLAGLVTLISVAFWIVLMVKAYKGALYKLPIAGELAEKWSEQHPNPPPPAPPTPPSA
jgi:uncharacterized membrane protein